MVTDYLDARRADRRTSTRCGFNLVGYGCTTCIGNSGPLPDDDLEAIDEDDLVVGAVLSGNRNFEGRINPDVRANYLASPPLVSPTRWPARWTSTSTSEPLGTDQKGKPVFLRTSGRSEHEVAGR